MLISSNSTTYHLYHQKTPEEVEAAVKSGLPESNSTGDTVSLLSNAMEELLANKIGVNKEKLDDLKKDIETLESMNNPRAKERLVMLTEKLEEMVKEATRAAN
jgi:hypothetical protein